MGLELLVLTARLGWRRFEASRMGTFLRTSGHLLSRTFLGAGLFAHTTYLVLRANAQSPPLSSPADWCLLSALVLALIAFIATIIGKRGAIGLFLLPVALGLVIVSQKASSTPFSTGRASSFWGLIHGISLLLATVVVSLGFVAGIMYLLQSYRLKRKLPPWQGLKLPSLEWLEQINSRALGISAWLVACGFGSGIVLSQIRNTGIVGYSYWKDPAVWSLAAMLGWLALVELFRTIYPAARRGRKVAYLTVASFLFLLIAIGSITLVETKHGML